jgi:hypothetical protein
MLRTMLNGMILKSIVFIILGIKIPLEVDFISNNDDASGVVVPIPAAPVDGKMFVCANA